MAKATRRLKITDIICQLTIQNFSIECLSKFLRTHEKNFETFIMDFFLPTQDPLVLLHVFECLCACMHVLMYKHFVHNHQGKAKEILVRVAWPCLA